MKTNYVKPMSEIATTMYESMLMLQNSGHQSNDGDAKGGVFDEEDEDEEIEEKESASDDEIFDGEDEIEDDEDDGGDEDEDDQS